MPSVYDFTAETITGENLCLDTFKGQVLLIVNTASACGFTPQYKSLQSLHERFVPSGFAVLGFPCNQFGGQEPGDSRDIAAFCAQKYAVSFPLFAKIDVNGANAHPLYKYLTNEQPGFLGLKAIKWNFTKFLVDRYGKAVARYGSMTKPEALADKIESLL
ncbi:glutathione peroxidase [Nitrobacteraceae bacterium AZCC 1564]